MSGNVRDWYFEIVIDPKKRPVKTSVAEGEFSMLLWQRDGRVDQLTLRIEGTKYRGKLTLVVREGKSGKPVYKVTTADLPPGAPKANR